MPVYVMCIQVYKNRFKSSSKSFFDQFIDAMVSSSLDMIGQFWQPHNSCRQTQQQDYPL